MKNFLLLFFVLGLALASAKTYSLTLFQPSVVGGTQLKAGDYQIDVQDSKVIIKAGKQLVESAVKVENADSKYASTTVRYAAGEGASKIREIRLGGTRMRLLFD